MLRSWDGFKLDQSGCVRIARASKLRGEPAEDSPQQTPFIRQRGLKLRSPEKIEAEAHPRQPGRDHGTRRGLTRNIRHRLLDEKPSPNAIAKLAPTVE